MSNLSQFLFKFELQNYKCFYSVNFFHNCNNLLNHEKIPYKKILRPHKEELVFYFNILLPSAK